MFSDTFAGIAPVSVAMFIMFQTLGAVLSTGLVLFRYPDTRAAAVAVVVSHTQQAAAADGRRSHTAPTAERTAMSTDDRDHAADDVARHPQVLFVCVHNAGRSQMAAALLEHHAAGRVDVRSAGSTPADEINPAVRAAMAEIGISLDRAHPKLLTTDAVQASDVVVTMGCGDTCSDISPSLGQLHSALHRGCRDLPLSGQRLDRWKSLTDLPGTGVDLVA
jgi:protein-tyrosine-phosphatase